MSVLSDKNTHLECRPFPCNEQLVKNFSPQKERETPDVYLWYLLTGKANQLFFSPFLLRMKRFHKLACLCSEQRKKHNSRGHDQVSFPFSLIIAD